MTAWVQKGSKEEVGIITDFVDPEYVTSTFSQRVTADWLIRITALNKRLVDTYLDIPYAETKCGYACSDQ